MSNQATTVPAYIQFRDNATWTWIGEPIPFTNVSVGSTVLVSQYIPEGYVATDNNYFPVYVVTEGDVEWAVNNPQDAVDYGLPAGAWVLNIGLMPAEQISLSIPMLDEQAIVKSLVLINGRTSTETMNLSVMSIQTQEGVNLGNQNGTEGTWNWDTTQVKNGTYSLILTGMENGKTAIVTKRKVIVNNPL